MTHAGIDGYSRMIVYMHCSTSNKALIVYELFIGAVNRFGLPSRVRSDQGRENIRVAQFMLEQRGDGRRSMITGSSTHNQRIERLWRDMQRCVCELYYRLFYHLENSDLLDPTNEIHIYALHFIYVPRINKSLSSFKEAWNHHRIRTEHNKSPHQLFTEGALRLHSSGLVALDFLGQVYESYGSDDGIVVSAVDNEEGVHIPENSLRLRDEHFQLILAEVDQRSASQNYGIELYEQTVATIERIISENPGVY